MGNNKKASLNAPQGLQKKFSLNTWGNLSKLINKGISKGRGSTYGGSGDKDGATYSELKTFSQLNEDSVNRGFSVYGSKVSITSGRLKGVQVLPQDFFNRYEKDLGLNLKNTDLVLPIPSTLKSGLGDTSLKRFHQYVKKEGQTPVRVAGSSAALTTQNNFVTDFRHNFIPGLEGRIKDLNPKLTYEQAADIVKAKMGGTITPEDSSKSVMSLKVQGAFSDNMPLFADLKLSDLKLIDKLASIADTKSPLLIGFDGERKTQNARLIWRVSQGATVTDVDATTGKILKSRNLSMDLGSEGGEGEDLFGNNVPVTGVPWPYYGSVGEPVAMTGNKKNAEPYHLACKKNDEPATSPTYCPSTTVVFTEMSPTNPSPTGVTSSTDTFAKSKPEVSLYKALLDTQAFFDGLVGYKGYRGTGEDNVIATLGKQMSQGLPNARTTTDVENNAIRLRFHGYPSSVAGVPTGPMVSHDVVGHEYFHGIYAYQVDPEETEDGEINVINEGLADFLGESIELNLGKTKTPWKIADQIFGDNVPNGYLRNLSDPKMATKPRPDTHRGYYYVDSVGCEKSPYCYATPALETFPCAENDGFCSRIHTNSTVVSHAFQLMADGGTGFNDLKHQYNVQPIGRKNAALLAMLSVFQLKSDDTIKDLRNITLAIARNAVENENPLNAPLQSVKSTLVESVEAAWFAVGVGDRKDDRYYSPSDANHDNFNVSTPKTTLVWQVFPALGEKEWVIEVGDSPNLSNSLYQYESAQAPEGVSIQSITKTASDIVSEGDKSVVKATFDLKPKTVYYWHICTNPTKGPDGNTQCTEWHQMQSFGTEARDIEAIYPADQSLIDYSTEPLTFRWNNLKGIDTYVLNFYDRLPKNELGKLLGKPETVTISTYGEIVEHPLPDMASHLNGYCWDVTPVLPDGQKEPASGINCYGIKIPAPKPISPLDSLEATKNDIEFQWTEVDQALSYELEICNRGASGQADCSSGEHLIIPSAGTALKVAAVGEEDHCWRIKAMGPNGDWGDFSGFTCFDAKTTKVTLIVPANGAQGIDIKSNTFTWELPEGQSQLRCGFFYQPLPEGTPPPSAEAHAAGSPFKLPGAWSASLNPNANGLCTLTDIPLETGKQYYWQAFGLSQDNQTILAASDVGFFKSKDMNPVILSPAGSANADSPQVTWQYNGAFGAGYAVAISAGGSTPLWNIVPPNSDPSQGYVRIDNLAQKSVMWTNLLPDTKYEVSVFVLDKEFKQSNAYPMATQSFTTEKPYQCNSQQQAGGPLQDTKTYNLGKKSGTFSLDFCTFTASDRILVSYENTLLWDSGCRATGEKQPMDTTDYNNCLWEGTPNLKYNGQSTQVTVTVDPGCDPSIDNSNTAWAYVVHCPQ